LLPIQPERPAESAGGGAMTSAEAAPGVRIPLWGAVGDVPHAATAKEASETTARVRRRRDMSNSGGGRGFGVNRPPNVGSQCVA
jgi:hypothetical protein